MNYSDFKFEMRSNRNLTLLLTSKRQQDRTTGGLYILVDMHSIKEKG
jgi:hypothetical protein